MKSLLLVVTVAVALTASACSTVRTYDRDGNMTGKCKVSGLLLRGGSCVGYANPGVKGDR